MDVQSGTRDSHLGMAVHDFSHCMLHSRMKHVLMTRPKEVLPTKWSLLPWVFDAVCKECRHPLIDLFAARTNTELTLYLFPVSDPVV